MGKTAALTDNAIIEQSCERASGVTNCRWQVSKQALVVFRSQPFFVSPVEFPIEQDVSDFKGAYLSPTGKIEVYLDETLPHGRAMLIGDDFEAVMTLTSFDLLPPDPPPRTAYK